MKHPASSTASWFRIFSLPSWFLLITSDTIVKSCELVSYARQSFDSTEGKHEAHLTALLTSNFPLLALLLRTLALQSFTLGQRVLQLSQEWLKQ